jgi:hypothetical protein
MAKATKQHSPTFTYSLDDGVHCYHFSDDVMFTFKGLTYNRYHEPRPLVSAYLGGTLVNCSYINPLEQKDRINFHAVAAERDGRINWQDHLLSLAKPLEALLDQQSVDNALHTLHAHLQTPEWPTLDDRALYGLAGELVRVISPHTEADEVSLLVQILIEFGNVINRAPHCVAEADYHALNEFAVLVGLTSKGRKGSSSGHVQRVFKMVDPTWAQERVQGGLSSGEGLIWAVRDPIVKTEAIREKGRPTGKYEEVIADQGISDKRLMVLESEFASTLRVLGREGNTLSAIIRQAWDSGTLRVLTKNSPAHATNAHISVIGHITKDELLRYLDSTEAGNGFGNRFLWLCVRRSKTLPEGGHLSDADLGKYVVRLRQAIDAAARVREITRNHEARAMWREVYPALSEGAPGLLGAMTSRAEAHVMRLSALYALMDQSAQVQRPHLEAALALWEYCEASARFIFGSALGDPLADELIRLLRANPEGLSQTDMYNHFGRHKSSEQIARALALIAEQGLADMVKQATAGRTATIWKATGGAQKAQKA